MKGFDMKGSSYQLTCTTSDMAHYLLRRGQPSTQPSQLHMTM